MCHLRPLDFVQKHPQNAQNAILENQISKNFRGGHAPHPPRNVSSFWAHAPVLWPSKNKQNPYLALPKKHLSSPGIGSGPVVIPTLGNLSVGNDNEVNVVGGMH